MFVGFAFDLVFCTVLYGCRGRKIRTAMLFNRQVSMYMILNAALICLCHAKTRDFLVLNVVFRYGSSHDVVLACFM